MCEPGKPPTKPSVPAMPTRPSSVSTLSEHALRCESLLQIARALREQVDWASVRERTASSPFAHAYFVLAEGLELLPGRGSTASGAG